MTDLPSKAWALGWAAGAAVVLVAAGLLQSITALARTLSTQSTDIVTALDGAANNTAALWEVDETNAIIAQITHDLSAATAEDAAGEEGAA